MSSPKDLQTFMASQGILFSFSGELSADIITSILHLLDNKLKLKGVGIRRKKNIVNIAIECLQNIHYHGLGLGEEGRRQVNCMVTLVRNEVGYELWFANQIGVEDATVLHPRLTFLNSLSTDQLHEEYLTVLDRGVLSPKGGGGLGLIRILREAGQPILFEITPTSVPEVLDLSLKIAIPVMSPALIVA